MPTTKTRHQVTETPGVAHALDVAEKRWPGLSKSALLAALAEAGATALERDEETSVAQRRALIDSLAGGFDDVYYDGYLEELRQDWPE